MGSVNNLPPFGQLNAPVQGATALGQAGTVASYRDLGLTGAGFGGQPGVPTTAENIDLAGEQLMGDALTYQNQQRYAMAQNTANQPKGAGTGPGTSSGGTTAGAQSVGNTSDTFTV